MAYKIKYLPMAVQDLKDIAKYLPGFYPKTALHVLKEIWDKISKLADTTNMYEVYAQDPSYRKLLADKYIIFYQIDNAQHTVKIHRALRALWNLPQYLE